MLKKILDALFGSKSERELKKFQPTVELINSLEEGIKALTEEQLKAKTVEFKERHANGEPLDSLLPEAFAVVREAARRTIGMRPYDVQLLGGMVMHQGRIAEMGTGEGKTLVATLPAYLHAISGKGVHIVTINDYLARRDRNWMGPIHEFLGLTVGFITHDMRNSDRQQMYRCDITYVTNNEIGFDYLRDNMVVSREERVLRPLNFAVVDEVDSILIDEARTPLIISGAPEESTDKYSIIDRIIPSLKVRMVTDKEEIAAKYSGEDLAKGYDAIVDEKASTVTLTDQGIFKAEKFLGIKSLYDDVQAEWAHHITQALRAHYLFERDVDYVIKDGEVIIVDEFTGRLMPGRRWSDGLHQAVESKEHLAIKEENQTLATITFQNFFKLYNRISGMTGTAMTEENEFWEIYHMDVVEIPSNKPLRRVDAADSIYLNERAKFSAIIREIEECWKKGQPMLVGTRSIEKSEKLAAMLRAKGIPHQVLNAKYHEMEAQIIAQAGRKGAVTIATNMAGRGTDIVLGGNPADKAEQEFVVAAGGLHVIGTERHEARRIDNQLRGRCARQGDPGSSRFYLALDDELMRLFGSDRITTIMEKLGAEEDEPIEHPLISRQIEAAQRRVEGQNFDIRKHLLDYDKVMNQQRTAVYKLRNSILDGDDVTAMIDAMLAEVIEESLEKWAPVASSLQLWDMESLSAFFRRVFDMDFPLPAEEMAKIGREVAQSEIKAKIDGLYKTRVAVFAEQGVEFHQIERMLLLQLIDQAWKNHLYELDHLQKSVGLRAYGQKDPLIEYQKESFVLYQGMMGRVRDQLVDYLFKIQLPPKPRPAPAATQSRGDASPQEEGDGVPRLQKSPARAALAEKESGGEAPIKKIGRNDLCPCGSGQKYKKCCGQQ
ncbi:MAG: preprotein translocase subunit SecA [Elusimicrobiales bacterium]|nr:preprotein translocase subunit SecA [Elusimicrobiales bacterium]